MSLANFRLQHSMYFSCERKKNSCAFNKEIRMVRRACIMAIGGKLIIGRILKGGMCTNFSLNRPMTIRLRDYCYCIVMYYKQLDRGINSVLSCITVRTVRTVDQPCVGVNTWGLD